MRQAERKYRLKNLETLRSKDCERSRNRRPRPESERKLIRWLQRPRARPSIAPQPGAAAEKRPLAVLAFLTWVLPAGHGWGPFGHAEEEQDVRGFKAIVRSIFPRAGRRRWETRAGCSNCVTWRARTEISVRRSPVPAG